MLLEDGPERDQVERPVPGRRRRHAFTDQAHDHDARRFAARDPPRPPIPALERSLGPGELEEALRSFHGSYYVQHPFHQLMYEGKLSQRQFQGWAANRLAYQRVVPRKDAAILSNCPDADVRREWIQRIVDHDGTAPGTGGIEMWIRLGVALGVPREEMEDERHVLPAVRLICESYVTFCKSKPWQEACASSLTELFAPKIHQQRIEAFPRHYPWIPPEALDYFKSRLVQAPRDVNHGLRNRPRMGHHAGAPAQGVRGARLQARDAVGDDRHHPQCLPRGMRWRFRRTRCPGSGALARLDYDPARQRPVLLYPEGAVLLNETGRATRAGGRHPHRRADRRRAERALPQTDVAAA
jgi:pyrroloquinoline-quinone synthase